MTRNVIDIGSKGPHAGCDGAVYELDEAGPGIESVVPCLLLIVDGFDTEHEGRERLGEVFLAAEAPKKPGSTSQRS